MTRTLTKIAAAAGLLAALAAPQAQAALGDALVAGGGHIVIRFEGQTASYDSLISVNGSAEFLPNHATPVGTTLDLGDFASGTALNIVLHVVNTGEFFHTGPGSANPDNIPHANVIYNFGEPGRTWSASKISWAAATATTTTTSSRSRTSSRPSPSPPPTR